MGSRDGRRQAQSDALDRDHELHRRVVAGCLARVVYHHGYTKQGPPGHAGFSLAHTAEDLAETLTVFEDVCREVARGGGGGR